MRNQSILEVQQETMKRTLAIILPYQVERCTDAFIGRCYMAGMRLHSAQEVLVPEHVAEYLYRHVLNPDLRQQAAARMMGDGLSDCHALPMLIRGQGVVPVVRRIAQSIASMFGVPGDSEVIYTIPITWNNAMIKEAVNMLFGRNQTS